MNYLQDQYLKNPDIINYKVNNLVMIFCDSDHLKIIIKLFF